jgi:hypothetical protein
MPGSLPDRQAQVDHLLQSHLPKHLCVQKMVVAHAMNVDLPPMDHTQMLK